MEKAKIAVIDDQEQHRYMARLFLELKGHEIIAEASTRQEALDLVHQIGQGDVVTPDVILLDGNLGHTDTREDASVIARELIETGVTSRLLGFSMSSLIEHGIAVEVDTYKDIKVVAEVIKGF